MLIKHVTYLYLVFFTVLSSVSHLKHTMSHYAICVLCWKTPVTLALTYSQRMLDFTVRNL